MQCKKRCLTCYWQFAFEDHWLIAAQIVSAIATSFPLLSQESFLTKLGTTRTVLAEEKSRTSIWALKFSLSGHFGPRNETTSQLNALFSFLYF